MANLTVLGIGTAVPKHRLDQRNTWFRISEALEGNPQLARWGQRIFAQCGVDSRYTCEPNLLSSSSECRYIAASNDGAIPTTEERMRTYRRESVPLAAEAAKKALADANLRPGGITHLLTVSCTGQFLPGLDAELAWQLDLRPDVERIPLTFLGCAAGITALREACRIVRADPAAQALIVTIELCTIHIQPSLSREDLYTASFFGDGASACVVGRSEGRLSGTFALADSRAVLFPDSADKMVWTVGNRGFDLSLSPQIPRLIADFVPDALRSFWGESAESAPAPELWAIHPGGRGIVDALQSAFALDDAQTAPSRAVLRQYGNMSSATILFVLDDIRRRRAEAKGGDAEGIAVAFGPGITAEFLRFAYQS